MSYVRQTSAIIGRQCFFITGKGYMGLGPATIEKGDAVCILFGCPVPTCFAESGFRVYSNRGSCVLGLMDGEALSENHDGAKKATFNIQ